MRTGYEPIGGRCFSCSEASVRAVSLSGCSSCYSYKAFSHIKIVSLKFNFRGMSLVCKAGSNGFAGNLEFSRQNKHGLPRSKNKQNFRDSSTSLEESQLFLSKIVPLLSGTSAPKFKPSGTPLEPRKKEMGNVFEKLKMGASFKKKKAVRFQGHGDEDMEDINETLEVVWKHISKRGEAHNSNGSSREDLDQSKQDGLFDKEIKMSSPNLARKHITPTVYKSGRNDSGGDEFLDRFETPAGSFGMSSPQLARERIMPMGRKRSSSNGSSGNSLDHFKQDGLFDKEKSTSSPKLAGKFVTQTGRKLITNDSSRDVLLEQSEQDGVIDEGKSTSSFSSPNFGELESAFVKLLHEHNTQMGKNSSSNGSCRDFSFDQSDQNGSITEEKGTASFVSNDFVKLESPTNRPVSNFRRRSPIPRVKFELIHTKSFANSNLDGKRESTLLEHEKREDSSDFAAGYSHNEAEDKPTVEDDLSAMKMTELKALAKARGLKGFSRLRKHQLLKLFYFDGLLESLSGGST